jgi:putrescine transport system substrate-binding protein
VFYANPNAASMRYVNADTATNKTIFPDAATLKQMVTPEGLPQNVRKVQVRAFSSFKSGL